MALIQSPGATVLLTSTAGTTKTVGSWFEVHPKLGKWAFQALLTASSAAATCGSTIYIEVSNDGVYPIATKGLTIALTNTSTDYVCDGGCFATSMAGSWRYVRANLQSLTTSTAGSAGSPAVVVTMGAAWPQ